MSNEPTPTIQPKPARRQVPCEVYSRIVGYLRPVQNWNKGKQQEFEDRKAYQAECSEDAEVEE